MKSSVDNLAIFGGEPAFAEPLHVGRPNIGDRQRLLSRFERILDTKWLTNSGPFEKEFEQQIAKEVGVRHCIAMCNATIALEITIRALGLSGEVIIPSFTFIATAHALQWQQITPVFCDIDPITHNLNPRLVERLITPRTTGIIGVHLWGRPCNVDALTEIAERHSLKLVFDAAHAFGCTYHGRKIGSFGDAEVFSFHATKYLNAFEGGAVVTNDDELAAKIRLMKNFGFAGYDNVAHIGTNGKMSEISAAMGITSLESAQEFADINRSNYQQYKEGLNNLRGIKLIEYKPDEQNNYQYVLVEVTEEQFGISRDSLLQILHTENVIARRYFYPGCHEMEPYRSLSPNAKLTLPETELLAKRVLSLPTGTSVISSTISMISQIIRFVATHCDEIAYRLETESTQASVIAS